MKALPQDSQLLLKRQFARLLYETANDVSYYSEDLAALHDAFVKHDHLEMGSRLDKLLRTYQRENSEPMFPGEDL